MIIKRLNSLSLLWLTLLIGFVLKFTISFNTGLFEDEAVYWNWSHSPDPSYSFTTLISLKIFSLIFGNKEELLVRLPALITNFIILLFLFKIGKLFNIKNTKILLAAVLFFSVPFVTIYTSFISPDSLLLLLSVVSIYFVLKILKHNNTSDWIYCGISLGLLTLSKYTGIIYFIITVFYLTLNKKIFVAKFFKNILLLLISFLVVISPLSYWNLSFEPVWLNHYIFTDADKVFISYTDRLIAFFLSQIAILLPVALILIILILRKNITLKTKFVPEKYLMFFFTAMLIISVLASLSGKIKGNWFFIVYIPLLISVIFISYPKYFKILVAVSASVNIILLIILNMSPSALKNMTDNYFGKFINSTFQNYWPGHIDNANNDRSWEERIIKMKSHKSNISSLSEEIVGLTVEYGFIATDDFNLCSLLEYYLKTEKKIYVLGDMRFKYINFAESNINLKGQNALVITYNKSDLTLLESKFDKVVILKSFNYESMKGYDLIYCENFNSPGHFNK